jgi:hypothetical protein
MQRCPRCGRPLEKVTGIYQHIRTGMLVEVIRQEPLKDGGAIVTRGGLHLPRHTFLGLFKKVAEAAQ